MCTAITILVAMDLQVQVADNCIDVEYIPAKTSHNVCPYLKYTHNSKRVYVVGLSII